MSQRLALVTGGGSGIGRAACVELAQRGARVIVTDLVEAAAAETAGIVESTGGSATWSALDVTAGPEVAATLGELTAREGPVGILVNCAGWDELRPFTETDEELWQRLLEVNFVGVLRTCAAVVPQMLSEAWGRIVNVASDAGRVGSSLESVYAGAKGAVIAFTKSLARELAASGISANAVCPGPTDTPLIWAMAERREGGDRFVQALERAIPMRRLARPEEVASAIAFFCEDSSGYITGQTLSVSGGLVMS